MDKTPAVSPRILCHDEEFLHPGPDGVPGTKVVEYGHPYERNNDQNSTTEEEPGEGGLCGVK